MIKVIRARYENDVLKPLEPVDLEEGKEVIAVIRRDIEKIPRKYLRILGKTSLRELLELKEEAQSQ